MTFTTPARVGAVPAAVELDGFRLPHAVRRRCGTQCGEARFETAKVEGRRPGPDGAAGRSVVTDRGRSHARVVVDALGWRRVLAHDRPQPPDAPLSRGLEVHPHVPDGPVGDALDVWVERDVVRRGYGWRVPAGPEARVGRWLLRPPSARQRAGAGSWPTAWTWTPCATRAIGSRIDCGRAADAGIYFVGDSAGHRFPLSGEGIRTAFYFGIAAGRAHPADALAGQQDVGAGRWSSTRPSMRVTATRFGLALRLQRLVPALPPRLLTVALRVIGRSAIVDRASAGTWARPTLVRGARPCRWHGSGATPIRRVTADRTAAMLTMSSEPGQADRRRRGRRLRSDAGLPA